MSWDFFVIKLTEMSDTTLCTRCILFRVVNYLFYSYFTNLWSISMKFLRMNKVFSNAWNYFNRSLAISEIFSKNLLDISIQFHKLKVLQLLHTYKCILSKILKHKEKEKRSHVFSRCLQIYSSSAQSNHPNQGKIKHSMAIWWHF